VVDLGRAIALTLSRGGDIFLSVDISKLDQLESYIVDLIKNLSELKNKNASLKGRISQLEKENKRFTEERDVIKTKIDGMLKNLEGIEGEKD
jgi:chromosome segregation ATPase